MMLSRASGAMAPRTCHFQRYPNPEDGTSAWVPLLASREVLWGLLHHDIQKVCPGHWVQ